VSIAHNNSSTITIKQMTNYLIDNVMGVGDKFQFITTKYFNSAMQNDSITFPKKTLNSNMIDQFLPDVLGGSNKCLRKFKINNKIIDKTKHLHVIRDII
jgi:hypothetical protein